MVARPARFSRSLAGQARLTPITAAAPGIDDLSAAPPIIAAAPGARDQLPSASGLTRYTSGNRRRSSCATWIRARARPRASRRNRLQRPFAYWPARTSVRGAGIECDKQRRQQCANDEGKAPVLCPTRRKPSDSAPRGTDRG
jgi:hypothetical protein